MKTNQKKSGVLVGKGQSTFSKMLAANPKMASRSKQVSDAARSAAQDEVRAIEQSEHFTAKDLLLGPIL